MDYADKKYIEWLQNETKNMLENIEQNKLNFPDVISQVQVEVDKQMEEVGKKLGLTGVQVKLLYSLYIFGRIERLRTISDLPFKTLKDFL